MKDPAAAPAASILLLRVQMMIEKVPNPTNVSKLSGKVFQVMEHPRSSKVLESLEHSPKLGMRVSGL